MPASVPPTAQRKNLCFWYQTNQCTKGDQCSYLHEMGTKAEQEQMKAQRERLGNNRARASTPKGSTRSGKAVCKHWMAGTCQMGDACAFSHSGPKGKGKGKPKGKGKGKGKSQDRGGKPGSSSDVAK